MGTTVGSRCRRRVGKATLGAVVVLLASAVLPAAIPSRVQADDSSTEIVVYKYVDSPASSTPSFDFTVCRETANGCQQVDNFKLGNGQGHGTPFGPPGTYRVTENNQPLNNEFLAKSITCYDDTYPHDSGQPAVDPSLVGPTFYGDGGTFLNGSVKVKLTDAHRVYACFFTNIDLRPAIEVHG